MRGGERKIGHYAPVRESGQSRRRASLTSPPRLLRYPRDRRIIDASAAPGEYSGSGPHGAGARLAAIGGGVPR